MKPEVQQCSACFAHFAFRPDFIFNAEDAGTAETGTTIES